MAKEENIETFYPATQEEWRQWLVDNHQLKQSIWLVCYKKESKRPTLGWSEIVDEALCFGWIDGKRKTIDQESFVQFICKRKPKSTWSRINKVKVERLIQEGLMTPAGLESIAIAKQNGSWSILDAVEELQIPDDLKAAFDTRPGSEDFFMSLSKSVRKIILYRITFAKRPESRLKRIIEFVEQLAENRRPSGV